jgi:hypothetical protein
MCAGLSFFLFFLRGLNRLFHTWRKYAWKW